MRRALRILALPAALMAAAPLSAEVLDFEALDGWRDDNHVEALQSFLNTCDLIEAPADGAAVAAGTAWADLLSVLEEDADLAPIARMLRSEIEGAPLADWRRAANIMGIHLKTADAIGLGPVLDLSEDPQIFEEAEITGGPDPLIVNHHTALARIADA